MTTIRAATIADMDRLIDLAAGLGAEDGGQYGEAVNIHWAHEGGRESFTRALEIPTSHILVAEVDGHLVGSLHGYLRPSNAWRTVPIAEIITLFVEPGLRNQRLGEALVAEFRTWATGMGAKRLAVSAFAANERAIRFYQRVGFHPYELMLEQDM